MLQYYDLPFTRNSTTHRILSALKTEPISAAQIRTDANLNHSAYQIRAYLTELVELGFATGTKYHFAITQEGVDAKLSLGGEPAPLVRRGNTGCNKNDLFMRPPYVAHELRDTCARQGGYDSRKYPSLVRSSLVWYGPGYRIVRTEQIKEKNHGDQ